MVRYCIASFLLDLMLYIVWTVLPFKALSLQASQFYLGLLPAISAILYILTCALTGGLSDTARGYRVAAAGCVVMACSCLMMGAAETLWGIAAASAPLGVGAGLFWPAVQAGIGRMSAGRALERNLGWFNIVWSSGKGLGFVCGGQLLLRFGNDYESPLWVAALLAAVVGLCTPHDPGHAERKSDGAPPEARADMARFMKAAWLANFAAWSIGSTINSQYPELIKTMDGAPAHFGWFLGLVYLFQTVAFGAFGRWGGWILHRSLFYVMQGAGLICVLLLPLLAGRPWIFLVTPVLGAYLGLCYVSSIYYSLRAGPKAEGRLTGFHEAILGSGNVLVPITGGALATGLLIPGAPFFLAGVVVAAMVGAQRVWIRP